MGCVVWVCSKRLWQNAPSILLHKSTGNFVVVKLQLWHHSVSAAVVNPTAFLPHHTSQCTSGDDAFATQIPWHEPVVTFYRRRPAFMATSTRCTRSVFSYLTVRGWCFWRRICLQLVLTDTSCPWNPISSFSRDVSTIPVHVSAR